MKFVAVLLVALTACEGRYGTYFNIDGDANQIAFDHVELFFGTPTDRSTMGTPEGVAIGKVFDRSFTMTDRFDVPRSADGSFATESEYWLPVADENRALGYVGVVASKGGDIVGVGELIDFKVEAGIVNKYDIELAPKPAGIIERLDVWGGDPGCFAWRRDRGGLSTLGVMAPDDADCDGLAPAVDCNDFCPTGAQQCEPDLAICGVPHACGAGCNASGACAIQQCLPDELCADPCMKKTTLDERMKCYSSLPGTSHLELGLLMSPLARPCRNALVFDVPGGHFCTAPKILWWDKSKDDYSFDIQPSATNPSGCLLSWSSPSNAMFTGDHHLLISFGGPIGAPRSSIVIGIAPGDPVECSTAGDAFSTSGSSQPYECR